MIKILVATHKRYRMPADNIYLPIHVGKEGKYDIGYIGDNTGINISAKNPNYCELTALYWGWKNMKCDYIGLTHYRRHFKGSNLSNDRYECILERENIEEIFKKYDAVLPKKRRYYIETLYSHYAHTHYAEHLDKTREILENIYPEYINSYDITINRTYGHMFNMFIMKKELADKYCEWLFEILENLEDKIDISKYDDFQARLYGRVSEILLNVWVEHNKISYVEISHIHMEKINWIKKGYSFIRAKLTGKRFKCSF